MWATHLHYFYLPPFLPTLFLSALFMIDKKFLLIEDSPYLPLNIINHNTTWCL